VHIPTPRDRLQNVITGLDILPEVPEDVITGLDILFEEEVEQAAPPVEPAPQKAGLLGRTGHIWRRANVAVASYFSDPEKGRRRQIAATLGLYALLGSTAWLLGHHPFGEHEQYGAGQPSTTIPTSPVPVAPNQPPHDAPFFDNLYPSNYHGEAYEWSTAADQFGPAYATQELQEMIGYARQSGVSIDTWGSAAQGHWGITSITVPLDGGGYQTYYDTPHKLAILQYFSAG